MELVQALQIVDALADGRHPLTGQPLAAESAEDRIAVATATAASPHQLAQQHDRTGRD